MKVYFDKALIQKEYVSFLAPLLGLPDFAIWGEDKQQIKDRYEIGQKSLSKVDKRDCDYFVYPKYFLLDNFDELQKYAQEAKSYKKKVIVFSYGEIDDYINIHDNILRYKRSTTRKTPSNEDCLPPFPEDLLPHNQNKIPLIQDKERYSIGFVGYAKYANIWRFFYYVGLRCIGFICRQPTIKNLLLRRKQEKIYGRLVNAGTGNYCRGEAIQQVQRLEKYIFNFIERKHALTTYTKGTLRKEYIDNLINSDFGLVVRGFGNYSFRQYEVMSLGKIPIYVDTGAKLPFQDEIPYNELFIKVPIEKIDNIGKYIDTFIDKNRGNLPKIQEKIRKIYEEYFIMKNYYSKIIQLLQEK